jgi:hypothetical protein
VTTPGSCLCGAVRFTVEGPLRAPDACHCVACRKWSGHFFVSTDVSKAALRVDGEQHVRWYASSEKVRRGFCDVCGSSLFWDPVHHDWIGVAMGALDAPSQTQIAVHVFTAEKGDYYALDSGVPAFPRTPRG